MQYFSTAANFKILWNLSSTKKIVKLWLLYQDFLVAAKESRLSQAALLIPKNIPAFSVQVKARKAGKAFALSCHIDLPLCYFRDQEYGHALLLKIIVGMTNIRTFVSVEKKTICSSGGFGVISGELDGSTNISLEFSGAEGEKIFSHWKCLANHIKYLTFIKCNMNERTIGNLLSYCTSLVNLTIDDSDYPFMTGRIFSESICNLNNLATVRRLEIQSSQYLSDAILMRISNIMPNLEHFSLSGDQITFHPAIWKRFYPSRQNFKYSDSVLTFKIVQNIIELRSETLTSIDFSRTQIGSDGLIALCKIPDLKLTVLNLEGCKNISQPGFEAIFSDQTGIIDLNINFCSNITDSIFRDICLRLERLKKFSFRKVSGITLCGLECITLLKEVRYLDMGYSDIFHDRQTQIVREKSLSAHLTHLDLGGLAFGQSFLKLISAQLKGLQYLNIQSCPVNDSMFAEITSNLLKLNVLKVAYLSISDQALTGVARVVASDEVDNKSDVQNRSIDENRHRIPLGLGYEEVIKTQARRKRVLKKTLETLSPDVAGPSLNNLKRLKELDLSHCVLVSDLSLMFAFKFFCLKTLSIAKCNITDEGLESLVAQPMPLNRTIEELDLSECTGITDRGLCKLLPELKRLRKLKLAVTHFFK
ncbi:hypothetical protein QYM36_004777 [Artemia franciscana]|uniref:F-box/LRR-repeat protein 15-like leucin rich repeat domain-containing protein n=1 Tax=Artemia franciscana TaxID=6661 RepID=A0AA88IHS8_ARTSF|nr:hypothetical protein QYM36_004777 [Artemia franciscana]